MVFTMAFSDLVSGIKQFHDLIHAPNRATFAALATGQAPDTFVIACSDSRLMPQGLTNASAGDLFVARNAGNFVPKCSDPHANHADGTVADGTAATLEYAVLGLGVTHIVILGHSDCGAMKALKDGAPSSLPLITTWITHGNEAAKNAPKDANLRTLTQANIAQQVDHLKSYRFVAERVSNQTLHLHGWYYDIGTGQVLDLNPETGEFTPL